MADPSFDPLVLGLVWEQWRKQPLGDNYRQVDDHAECRRCDDARHELEPGADSQGDDRLAERDQDDQSVPLGEVLRRDVPAAEVAERRSQIPDRERRDPDGDSRVALDERRKDDEERGGEIRARVTDQRTAKVVTRPLPSA